MQSISHFKPIRRRPRRFGRRGYSLIDVALGSLVMAAGVLIFAAFYPTAARGSKMAGAYSQASSEVQHKVDQIRSVGYGRINYTDLKAAGIIDASPNASPFRFEQIDGLSNLLWSPIGTITVASAGTNLTQVTVTLTWLRAPGSTQRSSHAVTILVTNE
ncbi:MAG: hypothetical protein K0Q72_4433 [Armatimonadetes bacterium]|jgi:hypothetical protein|nr:hypothetical protein [Armatimonadota bacterium]